MESKETLESLMQKAQRGDSRAYASLLGQVSQMLRHLLQPQVSNPEDLNDLVQECLISLHKARHTYQPDRPFKPWMFAIARFRLNDHFRSHYRRVKLEQAFLNSLHQDQEDFSVTFWDDRNEELYDAMRQLPEKQRTLLRLTKIEGMTAKEAGHQCGLSESAVKVSVHRSIKKITLMLRPGSG